MKNLLNLGKALNKAEQKSVIGGDTIKHWEPSGLPTGPCTGYYNGRQNGLDVDEYGSGFYHGTYSGTDCIPNE